MVLSKGQNIPQTIMVSVDGSMTEVMYPTFSLLQSDLKQLKSAMRRSMNSACILFHLFCWSICSSKAFDHVFY